MTSINGGYGTLPAPASLFGTGSTQAATPMAPASEPAATNVDAASLDQPNATWPTLINAHVMTLQALGTPAAVIGEIAAMQLTPAYLDQYIQSEIMQNPEGWDQLCGNPLGTARAGLQQLMPGIQLPAPGAGIPDIGSGMDAAGSAPAPAQGEGEGLVKGAVWAAAAAGVGLLGWKFFKGRKPPVEAVQLAAEGAAGFRAAAAGGGAAQVGSAGAGGTATAGSVAQELGERMFGVVNPHANATAAAATADSMQRGLGPANGFINSAGISALQFNMPMRDAVGAALADRYLGVLEAATASGQLGALAAVQGAMRAAALEGAQLGTSAAPNAALRAALADLLHAVPL